MLDPNIYITEYFNGTTINIRKSAGSHVPMLKFIGQNLKIKSVAEFGTGIYSLGAFLDRKIFKDIQKIHSYETNEQWIDFVKSRYSDSRWNIFLLKNDLGDLFLSEVGDFDLFFVDGLESHREVICNRFKDKMNYLSLKAKVSCFADDTCLR